MAISNGGGQNLAGVLTLTLGKLIEKLLSAMRQREELAVGEFAARAAYLAFALVQRQAVNHHPGALLLWIPNPACSALQQIQKHVASSGLVVGAVWRKGRRRPAAAVGSRRGDHGLRRQHLPRVR